MSAILALDLATVTGWARLARDGTFASGRVRFGRASDEGHGAIWFRAKDFIHDRMHAGGLRVVDRIVVEEPQSFVFGGHQNRAATEILYGLLTTVEAECFRLGLPVQRYNPATLKKFATGDGRAKKPAMVRAARARWGVEVTDHNEADAALLLALALDHEEGRWHPSCSRTRPRRARGSPPTTRTSST